MKLTKRWLSLGCLLAITAMLVACSSSDTTSKSQVKVKFIVQYTNQTFLILLWQLVD